MRTLLLASLLVTGVVGAAQATVIVPVATTGAGCTGCGSAIRLRWLIACALDVVSTACAEDASACDAVAVSADSSVPPPQAVRAAARQTHRVIVRGARTARPVLVLMNRSINHNSASAGRRAKPLAVRRAKEPTGSV